MAMSSFLQQNLAQWSEKHVHSWAALAAFGVLCPLLGMMLWLALSISRLHETLLRRLSLTALVRRSVFPNREEITVNALHFTRSSDVIN
jgi:hypothetical protein